MRAPLHNIGRVEADAAATVTGGMMTIKTNSENVNDNIAHNNKYHPCTTLSSYRPTLSDLPTITYEGLALVVRNTPVTQSVVLRLQRLKVCELSLRDNED